MQTQHYNTMNLPIAIIDARAPKQAIAKLQEEFRVLLFTSNHSTYQAIEGHPDVFMCCYNNTYVYAPNTPQYIKETIENYTHNSTQGVDMVGSKLKNSTLYNCVITRTHIFHKQGFTDVSILQQNQDKTYIPVPQAYTRCSMIALPNGACITSDRGIEQVLHTHSIPHIYCTPKSIQLPPYKYGFIGGTMGIYKDKIYVIGSLQNLPEHKQLQLFIQGQNCSVHELYNGPLYDGGGIFFIETEHFKN